MKIPKRNPKSEKTAKSEIEIWKRASETLQPDGVPWAKMATVLTVGHRMSASLLLKVEDLKKNDPLGYFKCRKANNAQAELKFANPKP